MTEAEWQSTADPIPMLEFVRDTASDRKLRLFACACCRAVWDDRWPHRSRGVIEVAERFADGLASDKELNRSRSLACQSAQNAVRHGSRRRHGHSGWTFESRLFFAADTAQPGGPLFIDRHNVFKGDEQIRQIGPPLLRCIFGNPFRPAAVAPPWVTSTVLALANGIYTDRAYDRLPILADALMDAGCEDAAILSHCRGDEPHVRGCWVIDSILGKG